MIFKNYASYVLGNVYLIPERHVIPPTYIPYFISNQFPIVVQIVTSKDRQPNQQHVIASMLTTIEVITSLPTHIPRGFDHQPPNGGQLGDSFRRSSHGGNPP